MTNEIVALRCPSCGGTASQPSRQLPFGAEFRCDHCSVISVLIINRALVALSTLQREGEKVCTTCGRIALREARYCQDGHALMRRCMDRGCDREFPVDHQRCDFCGTVQSLPSLPVISLVDVTIEPNVPKLIPGDLARKHNIIPVKRTGGSLTIAMADPKSFFVMSDIEFITGYKVEAVVATEAEIAAAIDLHYGRNPSASR